LQILKMIQLIKNVQKNREKERIGKHSITQKQKQRTRPDRKVQLENIGFTDYNLILALFGSYIGRVLTTHG
jgi:hypothetical protein